MQTKLVFALPLLLGAVSATRADEFIVVNSTCYGAAPLQPPTTTILAERTFRVNGSDSANLKLRRKTCGDGSTALYATFTAFDWLVGNAGVAAVIQNGSAYTPIFSPDPQGCRNLDFCGMPIYLGTVVGFPYTTVITGVFTPLETVPAFDDEQAFTLSLAGGFNPTITTTHAIPASGSAGTTLPASRTLSDNMTGTWWNPNRGGEGYTFDIGTFAGKRYLFFTWYTYVAQRSVFLSGSAELVGQISSVQIPVFQTRGAQFGTQFVPGQVIPDPVGSVKVERLACDLVELSYTGSLGAFATQTISPLWPHDFGATCQ